MKDTRFVTPVVVDLKASVENGRHRREHAGDAGQESPRTTKLYDRTSDDLALDPIERIAI